MKKTKFTMIAVAVGLTFSLAGCGLSDRWQSVVKTAKLAYKGHPDVVVTRKQIQELPYASLGVRYGDSGRVLVVLASYNKRNLHWVSADKNLLVTHKGHLIRTAGMDGNRLLTRIVGGKAPFAGDGSGKGLLGLTMPYTYTQIVDMQPGDRFGVPIRCTIVHEGDETIEIVARRYETQRFREDCVSEVADWEFSNTYWADKNTGFIWRSEQQLLPEKPVFTIEVFKPAA